MIDVHIREATPADASAIAALSGELGYPSTSELILERMRFAATLGRRALYVACSGDAVSGWIDLSVCHHMQSGAYVEIGGLVVAERARNHGIGGRLLEAAERWAASQGVVALLVRSQVSREAAHRFYLREGYERVKTSAVFQKNVNVE